MAPLRPYQRSICRRSSPSQTSPNVISIPGENHSLKYNLFPDDIVFIINCFYYHGFPKPYFPQNLGIGIDRDAAAYVDRHPTYGLQCDDDRHHCMRDCSLFCSHRSQGSMGEAEGRKGSSIAGMMLSFYDTLFLCSLDRFPRRSRRDENKSHDDTRPFQTLVYVVCARVLVLSLAWMLVWFCMCTRMHGCVSYVRRCLSEQLQQAMLRSLGVKRTPEQLERKYGARWLSKCRASREIRKQEKVDSIKLLARKSTLMVCKYVLACSAAVYSYHAHTNDSSLR